MDLTSKVLDVEDAFAANELFQRNGWTDGLPIVPPTEERVRRFLDAARLAPEAIVGVEPVRRRRITAEKVAIAAVMAGCLPEYLPVVVAGVKAMCAPEFGLHGSTASTGGSAPFIVVNGPVRIALGMNATHNVLANASRANATIGRSIRLIILNVLGGIPTINLDYSPIWRLFPVRGGRRRSGGAALCPASRGRDQLRAVGRCVSGGPSAGTGCGESCRTIGKGAAPSMRSRLAACRRTFRKPPRSGLFTNWISIISVATRPASAGRGNPQ